ncbi:endo alpha-1,4 polygalactosaminidase [Gammaproteobacteria bacterium]|nr:endo alpha-1,4 polygalactosaminidase [Gammaproteobacteria bacterium]
MKILKITLFIILFWPFLVLAKLESVAFYYGVSPPLEQLHAYDAVIVDTSTTINPKKFNTPNSMLYAYVSLGEVSSHTWYKNNILKNWIVAKNNVWKSEVIDQSNKDWQRFFINNVITKLWDKGYRGFFFDTIDSYTLISNLKTTPKAQISGMVEIINLIKKKYPSAKIILNRGFELLPFIKNNIEAVAAESLFSGWDQSKKKYITIPNDDREYLLNQLNKVKKLNLPVIVIDYVSPNNLIKADLVAEKIKSLGFIPWVTDPNLEKNGIGSIQPLARKLFVFYTEEKNSTTFTPASFMLLALPLQYMGYIPEYHSIDSDISSYDLSKNEYAGIIIWGTPKTIDGKKNILNWMLNNIKKEIPIAVFESFPFELNINSAPKFGLDLPINFGQTTKKVSLTKLNKDMIGYEIKPNSNRLLFMPIKAKNSEIYLQYKDNKNKIEDAVAITPWGGYALSPFVITQMPNEMIFWVIDPFLFLEKSLRLKELLVPEVTTENGRRLMFVHIDGDGFPSKAEWRNGKIAAIELKDKILHRYKIPTGVSVITADIAPYGLYPKKSESFQKIAKEIFSIPWVESASHTFSHPFDWVELSNYKKSGKYNLPVKNYVFSSQAEIVESVKYITENLTPKNRPCKVLYWSGRANPTSDMVGLAYKNDILNINGGDSFETYANQSIGLLSSYGLMKNNYYQVYSAMSNENIFTNNWLGPFYGFEKVIETFKLTDTPKRLKPIGIYYHFYSVSKIASLKALIKVYDWALKQKNNIIYPSEYIKKVLDFNETSISKDNHAWVIKNKNNIHEFRAPKRFGFPDLVKSENLIGYNIHNDAYYLHLGNKFESRIFFSNKESKIPYIVDSNGWVEKFEKNKNEITLRFKSHVPLIVTMTNLKGCTARYLNIKKIENKNEIVTFNFVGRDSNDLFIKC